MEYNFPSVLLDHFKNETLRSCGQKDQAGTFAIALGRKIENVVEIEELIYPSQEGKSDQIKDKGK